jgi:glutathione reductase (NADPH)
VRPEVLSVGDVEYSADHIVLAPGSLPVPLGIPGAEWVADSEVFMALEELPASVVFIGGGFISFEFAHMAAAAGARVAIVHRSARVLNGFDRDLAAALMRSYRAKGIEVHTQAPVLEVRRGGDGFEVVCGDGSVLPAELVVHGAGRAPALSGLGLEAAGISSGSRGIEVDSHMRVVGAPHHFAVGDAASLGAPLTPVATLQARIAVREILEPGSASFDGAVTPSVVFSDPPLASVGLDEESARSTGRDVVVTSNDMTEWASARRVGATVSMAKTVVDAATGLILGAHVLGPHAEEVINVFAAAMRGALTAEQVRMSTWGYPSGSSDIAYMV